MRREAKSCGAFRAPHSELAERPRSHSHEHHDSWAGPGEPRTQWTQGSLWEVAMRAAMRPANVGKTPHSTGFQAAMSRETRRVIT